MTDSCFSNKCVCVCRGGGWWLSDLETSSVWSLLKTHPTPTRVFPIRVCRVPLCACLFFISQSLIPLRLRRARHLPLHGFAQQRPAAQYWSQSAPLSVVIGCVFPFLSCSPLLLLSSKNIWFLFSACGGCNVHMCPVLFYSPTQVFLGFFCFFSWYSPGRDVVFSAPTWLALRRQKRSLG